MTKLKVELVKMDRAVNMERTFKLNFSLLPSENGGEAAAILRHMADEVEAVGTLEPCHWQNLNAPDFMRGKWKVEKNVED